jgi:hypothetical protein
MKDVGVLLWMSPVANGPKPDEEGEEGDRQEGKNAQEDWRKEK